jgi:flagellin-like protein
MLKSKRGISPILATLLLIVIAVAAIVVTYAWVITFTGSTTGQAGIMLVKTNVYYNGTYVVIDVKNTGISDAKIQAVYIGLSAGALVEQSASYNPPTKMVTANGGMIKITVAYPNTVGTPRYYFKIVPELGQPIEFNEVRS